jgi:coproporphyrinogen III oxidase
MKKEEISNYFKELQNNICHALEKTDGKAHFFEDNWERECDEGGGRSKIIQDGAILAKGGVMFSAVYGELNDKLIKMMELKKDADFFATGVSIVIHPQSPRVPIIHMNVRYFELSNGDFWFGGGIDLTPHYVDEADARWFHQAIKKVCDKHDSTFYPKFKTWADDYFFNSHRNESRGIGGIFFDYLKPDDKHSKEQLFDFVKDVGESFAPIYTHFMQKNKDLTFTEKEKAFQQIRRGRYVEFNLVHDRGTKFGLETNGRTESILVSMPPHADWAYNYIPEENSAEAHTMNLLKKGINWI